MSETSPLKEEKLKCGYAAIIGRPNVGKSTLVNLLLDFHLSIITPKPQTTRNRILGILSGENFQIIFYDTPGLLEPQYELHRAMVKAAKSAIEQSDVVLLLVEASAPIHPKDIAILDDLKNIGKPLFLVINKIDLVPKTILLPLIDAYWSKYEFKEIVPISALKNDNVDQLKKIIIQAIPEGFPFYPVDAITEHPVRFFVSEIIREKIFQNYGEEIPYSTAVVIDEFKDKVGAKDHIKARIVVEKQSQKGIIIGKGGAALKKIGQAARKDIEAFLGREVYLELWVAVREKWRQKDTFLREFGYS
jgi:GTP-binding protein Era